MTAIKTIIRDETDRLYPMPTREPDWDGVIQRVAQLGESPGDRRVGALRPVNQRRVVLALVAGALAAAASLTLIAPWSGGPSFVQQALAALGGGRYVHAVFQGAQPDIRIVSLGSGRTRPVTQRIEWVYDTKTSTIQTRYSLNGVALFSEQNGIPDPAVTGFANGYRKALANGRGRVIGETTFNGAKAKIIRFPLNLSNGSANGLYEDVLVATDSHRPLLIRYRTLLHLRKARTVTYRVIAINSSNAQPRLSGLQPIPSLTGSATNVRQLGLARVANGLGHAALWPGETVGGATLRKLRLQRVTTSILHSYPPRSSTHGLRLDYRAGTDSLVIEEAATPQYAYGFYSASIGASGPVPKVGEASLAHLQPAWQAQLHKNGLYITIRATERSLAIAAARALVPIP
jgi:hypothetical protein